VVRTLVSVAVLCAVVALGGGCASHRARDEQGRARRSRIPTDRSVLALVAPGRAKPASGHPAPAQTVVAAAPAPTPVATFAPAPVATAVPVATPAPQFQPVDPTDFSSQRPAYVGSRPLPRPAHPAVQPVVARLPSATPGSRYLVRKGDTLFGIARTRYGDGKRWQQIASANPGLTPATLQAGATIVVP